MLIVSVSYFLQSLDILHICRFFSVISQFQHCTSGVLSTDPYKKDNCGDFFSNHAWDQKAGGFHLLPRMYNNAVPAFFCAAHRIFQCGSLSFISNFKLCRTF